MGDVYFANFSHLSDDGYVSSLMPYLDSYISFNEPKFAYDISSLLDEYEYYVICNCSTGEMTALFSNNPIYLYIQDLGGYLCAKFYTDSGGREYRSSDGIEWNYINSGSIVVYATKSYSDMTRKSGSVWAKLVDSSHDIYVSNSSSDLVVDVIEKKEDIFDSTLGYLQNVKRTSTYVRGALYNYDEDSLTYHFYHDLESTTGVDLSSGNYVIRHYVANATVKGYEEEDILEMSKKVLGGEYDASQGYFSYLDKEYDEKLIDSGFEYPGFFDTLFGQFVLQHHYLQIVDLDTNEVGGYLHLYPKDETGDFGVELVYEGLDNNFEVDDTLESGVVKESEGSGLTHDEALENAEEKEKNSIDLSGVDELTGVLKSYASQIGNVTNGLGALLSALPPFMFIGLGIGVCLLVLVIIVNVIRG